MDNAPTPQGTPNMDGNIIIFSRFKTVKGKRMDAHDYGKKAWVISVTPEQNARYWAKRKGKAAN